jgi:hypothetical protein
MIVITATRAYQGQSANGEARVFVSGSTHARLAAARAWLGLSDALSANPAVAYHAAVYGVSELGPDYAARGVREETHVKEMAAKDEFDAGHHQLAATIMHSVLRSRIAMYQRRYAAEVE